MQSFSTTTHFFIKTSCPSWSNQKNHPLSSSHVPYLHRMSDIFIACPISSMFLPVFLPVLNPKAIFSSRCYFSDLLCYIKNYLFVTYDIYMTYFALILCSLLENHFLLAVLLSAVVRWQPGKSCSPMEHLPDERCSIEAPASLLVAGLTFIWHFNTHQRIKDF